MHRQPHAVPFFTILSVLSFGFAAVLVSVELVLLSGAASAPAPAPNAPKPEAPKVEIVFPIEPDVELWFPREGDEDLEVFQIAVRTGGKNAQEIFDKEIRPALQKVEAISLFNFRADKGGGEEGGYMIFNSGRADGPDGGPRELKTNPKLPAEWYYRVWELGGQLVNKSS
jgi:hypothetical protein